MSQKPHAHKLPARSLPVHWQRGRQFAVLLTLALVAAATFLLRPIGTADKLDRWWLRARFTLRESVQPSKPDKDIVLVTIDDKSLSKWKEPFILWGPHLADAIDRVNKGGARVVALDWYQPVRSEEWFTGRNKPLAPFFAKNDEQLTQALSAARSVVIAKKFAPAPQGQKAQWILPNNELLFSLPDSYPDPLINIGYADLNNTDSVVAAMLPAVPEESSEVSFAGRIVERYLGARSKIENGAWTISGKDGPTARTIAAPLRSDGTLLVNYHTPPAPEYSRGHTAFPTYSLFDIAQPAAQPDTRFRDKIVIIGATYTGSNDSHYVPFLENGRARSIPGMEIQANLVRTLLDGKPIGAPSPNFRWLLAIVPGLCGILAFSRLHWIPAAIVAILTAVLWVALSLGLFIYEDYALTTGLPLIGLLIGAGGMGAYRAFGEERERQQVLGLWGRYQDPRQVEYLLQHPEARGGQGQEAPVTVLFADLKNFTKTVEHLSPSEALQVLNRYLALMTDVIRDEYGGFVDKYLGDGLMAQWGAPPPWKSAREGEDHATTAVRACLELERRTRELTKSIAGDKDVTFGLRLTLHTGPVVVGWVGASRLEFTIIGDTVNVTSRLQETAKELGCEFLISETTYASVEQWVRTGQETEVMIRGRQKPLRVYEILGEQAQKDSAVPPSPAEQEERKS